MIVQELQAIQRRCGYLPDEELRRLSKEKNVPLHRLHEVASFYPLYRLTSPPAADVRVCRDMACHLRGAAQLIGKLKGVANELGGDRVHVDGVSCLGQCDCPVAVTVNDNVYRGKDERELRDLIARAVANQPLPHQHADRKHPGWKIDPYKGNPTYDAVKALAEKRTSADEILKQLEASNLRGMGGAGFPTFRKWSAVRGVQADTKYIVCNADESEPGTFKDRELLRRTPHLTLEGMILAGLVTGATRGILYIRHEFHEEGEAFEEAIRAAEKMGACGDNVFGSGKSFPVEVYWSPGGYIQGEETALLEAIEDRRGEPRNKPPFPTVSGLFGKPTVINNVETLAWVPGIVRHGGAWYADGGTHGAKGMRFVSISGDVNRPGVYEVPFGQTVRELVFDTAGGMAGGQRLKAVATSGPSGGFLPAQIPVDRLPPKFAQAHVKPGAKSYDLLDLPLDLNTVGALGGMLGAACVVYGDRRDMLDQALNCVSFFRNESCGKCVPCRMGSEKLVEVIEQIRDGQFTRAGLPVIQEVADAMCITSICGLGQVASNPITYVLKYFPEEVEKYLRNGR